MVVKPRILITPWVRNVSTTHEGTTLDLVSLSPSYSNAVVACGGVPLVMAPCEVGDVPALMDGMAGLLLSGGRDLEPSLYGQENTDSVRIRRDLDELDIELTREAMRRELPILGICRGMQVVNVALGGDLRQEVLSEGSASHPTYPEMREVGDPRDHRHGVALRPGSRIAAIYDDSERITVNSLHHQAVGRVGEGLVVTATAEDGTIEAVEHPLNDLVAVQWHPEQMREDGGEVLFADLVERARSRATMTP